MPKLTACVTSHVLLAFAFPTAFAARSNIFALAFSFAFSFAFAFTLWGRAPAVCCHVVAFATFETDFLACFALALAIAFARALID